jgi:transposase-like protein
MTDIIEQPKPKTRRPWTKDRKQTVLRLTAVEQKMLKALVKKLGVSQNSVMIMALREMHEKKAA